MTTVLMVISLAAATAMCWGGYEWKCNAKEDDNERTMANGTGLHDWSSISACNLLEGLA